VFGIYFDEMPEFRWDPERMDDEDGGYGRGSLYRDGVIVLGDDERGFRAPLSCWREQDYEAQWRDGVERLVAGAESSALVVEWDYPADEQWVMFFPLFRLDGTTVAVQKRLWPGITSFWQRRVLRRSFRLQPEEIYGVVGSYSAETEDGDPMWEVRLPLSDFADYLSRQR